MTQDCETPKRPRILFLDAYDSFSNNIVALVESSIAVDVVVIKIDDPRYFNNNPDASFRHLLADFDAVIAGPGPGHPNEERDVGLIAKLWELPKAELLPVFGICLGFQSLALSLGARVERLKEPRHGMIAAVSHKGEPLFNSNEEVIAIQYNSLHAVTGHAISTLHAQSDQMWMPSAQCPSLQPLAWTVDDVDNGPILMAYKDVNRPFWAVQFHPESVCTNRGAAKVIKNWWVEAQKWTSTRESRRCRMRRHVGQLPVQPQSRTLVEGRSLLNGNNHERDHVETQTLKLVDYVELCLNKQTTVEVAEKIKSLGIDVHLLESGTGRDGTPLNGETGRYSILACNDNENVERLEYSVASGVIRRFVGSELHEELSQGVLWDYLKNFMQLHRATGGPESSPFWGGLVGYVSYEACLERINVKPLTTKTDFPDVCFMFVDRSVVIDHLSSRIYIQTLRHDDSTWITKLSNILGPRNIHRRPEHFPSDDAPDAVPHRERRGRGSGPKNGLSVNGTLNCSVTAPQRSQYCRKVRVCQEALRAGDSYELCLTDETLVHVRHEVPAWEAYKRLRQVNPAPFGAFLDLKCSGSNVTILSSSPERFLCWDRKGQCQFRPIKGTVRKTPDMTRAKAQKILKSPKERAENLMITDLIRHDLHGVLGSGNVHIKKLMSIEEYQTVYQLVSVVEGELSQTDGRTGLDVLAASLPPGSMTGAPKKRSCEMLQHIEGGKRRGLYSGVLGYLDVGGGADFSVVIRTAYKVATKEDAANPPWRIGAGGAITIQSNELVEWEEMESKRDAVLDAFMPAD